MEATVSEQNPVATMLQYYKTANMSRMEPQLLGLYARKKREKPLAHISNTVAIHLPVAFPT